MSAGRTPAEWAAELAEPPPPGSPYGVPIPGSEQPGRSAVYRHHRVRDIPLVSNIDPEVQTLHDSFEKTARQFPKRNCLGHRPWNPVTKTHGDKFEWMSYAETAERRKNLGAGLVELHKRINHTADKHGVGLWSPNRPEWQLVDLACASQSLFSVSLYETLGPDATEYIIRHAELACVATSINHIPTLLKLAPKLPNLKLIISLDTLDHGEVAGHSKADLFNEMAKDLSIQILSIDQVEEIGRASGRPMRPAARDDICTINYTSGTTGMPKGVVLLHSNAVAALSACSANGLLRDGDSHLSYLPLAHIYSRMTDGVAFNVGASIGFFRGDILGLVDDMKILKPSGFVSVPRLFNKFNTAVRAGTLDAPGVRGALSRHVIETKKANMRLPMGKATNAHWLYDRIWTPKVRAAVGLDRTHSMISGSAQLDPDVQEFLRAAFGNEFLQGWGMTETYAVGTLQIRGDFSTGNIGAPNPSTEFCLESVPELEYTVDDKPRPRGELLCRGPTLFKEYFKNPEETKKTIEPDGWFHTGDICEIDEMGRIKIIDRKKNVLKLAQGEYISPERIENAYLGNTGLVSTAFIHGDGTESNLVGIFGIDPLSFPAFASQILGEEVTADNTQALVKAANHPKVKAAFLKKLDKIGKDHKFNSYEKVKNVYLDVDPFTVDNGLLTPTLKTKRPQCAKKYRTHLDQLYAEIKSQEGSKAKAKL